MAVRNLISQLGAKRIGVLFASGDVSFGGALPLNIRARSLSTTQLIPKSRISLHHLSCLVP